MKLRLVALLFFLGLPAAGWAQTDAPVPGVGNNQVVSRDAIGLRIVPNPEHFSPLQWYNRNITVKGSPQSLIVDGYEAVRDGRTVYVNAAKIVPVKRCVNNPGIICQNDGQCGVPAGNETRLPLPFIPTVYAAGECQASGTPEIYTNIYIISYNQNPEAATTDIFGQLLQYWKFNIDVKNCSDNYGQACTDNRECNSGVCQPTAVCSQTDTRACINDNDCPQDEFCLNKKSTIIRDTRRLADLRDMRDRLEQYNTIVRRYPVMNEGTYLSNRSVSTWPSWSATFSSSLGSPVPTDPVNKLGACAGFEAQTCWNETTKTFAGQASPLRPPAGSRVYYYQYTSTNNSYRFCGIFESGYVRGLNPNSEYCQTGQQCNRNCSNKQCGDDGCGGSCGTCPSGNVCQSGICRRDGSIQNQE